ncbi:hypothetical protein [Nostoc sp. UHCC 0252]|nr:hypothetical protein [Nostoc sp. UHCC 0252]MEA5601607.1 hypothetical protein [Nostoc sp. UHCC 0252]
MQRSGMKRSQGFWDCFSSHPAGTPRAVRNDNYLTGHDVIWLFRNNA